MHTERTPSVCLGLRWAQLEGKVVGTSRACFLQMQRVPWLSLLTVMEAETGGVKGEKVLVCFLPKCSRHTSSWQVEEEPNTGELK